MNLLGPKQQITNYFISYFISYLNPYFQFSSPGVWEAALNTATSPLPPPNPQPRPLPPDSSASSQWSFRPSSLWSVFFIFYPVSQIRRRAPSGSFTGELLSFFKIVNCPAFNFFAPTLFLVHPWALICSSSYFYSSSYYNSQSLDNFLNYSLQEIVVASFIFEILTHDKFIILKFQNIRLALAW